MKVLAISFLWTAMIPFFKDGKETRSGMPAFFEMWIRLLTAKHIKNVYLILLVDKGQLDEVKVPDKYKDKLKVYVIFRKKGIFQLLYLFEIYFVSRRVILKEKPDKYLGFGSISFFTWFFNRIRKAPDQRRLYGISTVFEDLEKSKLFIFLKHPFSFLSINLSCTNLFITNDGSHGDWVFKKIGNKNTHFHFHFNGVDPINSAEDEKRTHLSFIGRIYPWKGQIYLVEALAYLKDKYGLSPNVKLIGQISDEGYANQIKEIIHKHKLDNVEIIEGIPQSEVFDVLNKSIMTFSLYQTSNFGNVIIEALSAGVPVLTRNVNRSLDAIPENCYITINSYDSVEIALKIKESIEAPQRLVEISKRAKKYSGGTFESWENRINKEMAFVFE